jgi:hypothetical protein
VRRPVSTPRRFEPPEVPSLDLPPNFSDACIGKKKRRERRDRRIGEQEEPH